MLKSLTSLSGAAAVFAAGLVTLSAASAQEEEAGPQKRENVTYHTIYFIDYKPGNTDEAEGIIEAYFEPASRAAGTPTPYVIHFQTGSWDHAIHWSSENFDDLHWIRTEHDVAWWARLMEIAGSEDEAQAVWDRFQSYIARQDIVLGHHHETPEEE